MNKVKGYEFFSKTAGVEVTESYKKEKVGSVLRDSGRVTLRFFTTGDTSVSWRYIMAPSEAFMLSIKIVELIKGKDSATISLSPHCFKTEEEEITSILSVEKWARGEKNGFAIKLQRKEETINVAFNTYDFLFLSEVLKMLSTNQAWKTVEIMSERIKQETDIDSDYTEDFEGEMMENESLYMSDTSNEPITKPSVSSGFENGSVMEAAIEAVRKDKQGILVQGTWYKINEKTTLESELIKGKIINLYYSKGEKCNFANAIYSVN